MHLLNNRARDTVKSCIKVCRQCWLTWKELHWYKGHTKNAKKPYLATLDNLNIYYLFFTQKKKTQKNWQLKPLHVNSLFSQAFNIFKLCKWLLAFWTKAIYYEEDISWHLWGNQTNGFNILLGLWQVVIHTTPLTSHFPETELPFSHRIPRTGDKNHPPSRSFLCVK